MSENLDDALNFTETDPGETTRTRLQKITNALEHIKRGLDPALIVKLQEVADKIDSQSEMLEEVKTNTSRPRKWAGLVRDTARLIIKRINEDKLD